MGIFDFLKPKHTTENLSGNTPSDTFICDIDKTAVIEALFEVPKASRDAAWREQFLENVETACFASTNPQVMTGPDGFPYFVLKTPEHNVRFESFCIRELKNKFLLEKGIGVSINPTENDADWVFTYGDIVNLHLNNEFYTSGDAVDIEYSVTLQSNEEWLIAQPSEEYLPAATRRNLKRFLQSIGIEQPKIMLVVRPIHGQMVKELLINIFREDFDSDQQFQHRLNQISWLLPRHYIILVITKDHELVSKFQDL